MLTVGSKAPEFELSDSKGQTFKLSDHLGQRALVLFFYPKDDSFGCTKEACAFRDSYQDFSDAGAEVIGISSDDLESHQRFAQKHQLPYILLSDSDNTVRKLYQVPATLGILPGRTTYVVDKDGIIAHAFDSQMNFDGHMAESLKVVKALVASP